MAANALVGMGVALILAQLLQAVGNRAHLLRGGADDIPMDVIDLLEELYQSLTAGPVIRRRGCEVRRFKQAAQVLIQREQLLGGGILGGGVLSCLPQIGKHGLQCLLNRRPMIGRVGQIGGSLPHSQATPRGGGALPEWRPSPI